MDLKVDCEIRAFNVQIGLTGIIVKILNAVNS